MKNFLTILVMLVLLFSSHTQPSAKEQPTLPYFGVGATVKNLGAGEFLIKTKGMKAEEGFVYTPQETFSKEKINYQIELKGKGTVMLRISETDARGRYIKEEGLLIDLTNEWNTYALPFKLESHFSQIDAFVITKSKAKTEFSIKNLHIKEE